MLGKLLPTVVLGVGALVLVLVGAVGAEDEAPTEPLWTPHTSGLEITGVSSLRMHPKRPDRLLAHVHGVGIAQSFDEGKNWEALHEGLEAKHVPEAGDPVVITLDPRDPSVLWLVTKGHVYRSENGGERWESKTTGALRSYTWDRREGDYAIRGVVVDPKNSRRVLAGTWTGGEMRGGLFETMDGGKTWDQIAGNDVEKSELGHDAWPIVLDPRTDKNLAVGGSNGFWHSDDRGRKFKRVDPGEIGTHHVRFMTEPTGRSKDVYAADGRALWRSKDGGKRWDKKPVLQGDVLAASASPWSRNRLYAFTRDRGLLVSDDARNQKWTEVGLPDLDIREILVHPREKTLVYFASPSAGLIVSRDEGKTLEPVKSNVQATVPRLIGVAHHPEERGRVLTASEHGIVYSSVDGGTTWERAGWLGMEPAGLRADTTTAGAWFALGPRVLRSNDNGATWETVWSPGDPEERIVAFDRLDDGTWFALLERSARVAMSKDGKSWTLRKAPTKSSQVWARSVAVDRMNPKHLLLATRNLGARWTAKEKEGGAYESWDGGHSWKQLSDGFVVDKKPLPSWNRGRMVAMDSGAGVLFYAADGLGLFARRMVSPVAKPPVKPRWVDLGVPLKKARVLAWTLVRGKGETPSTLLAQVEGENDTRVLVRTTMDRVLGRLESVDKDGEVDPKAPPIWDTLPDPGAPLSCLAADPKLGDRYVACDAAGVKGVLRFGIPGEAAEEEVVGPVAPRKGPKPPEGLLAFSAGADGSVRIWDLHAGEIVGSLAGHTDEVYGLALAPDESRIATGSLDQSVRLWDASDGSAQAMMGADVTKSAVSRVVFDPDSSKLYVALAEAWTVLEWDLETQATRTFEGHRGRVVALAVSPDGTLVASGSNDRDIRLWLAETGASGSPMAFGSEVLCLAFSPDGSRLYAGGRGSAVKIFNVAEKKELLSVDIQATYVTDLAVSTDGKTLFVSGDRGVLAVNTADLTPVSEPADGRYTGPTKAVFSMAVSLDGKWIVGGDMANGLWLWQQGRAKPIWHSASAHAGAVHAVALTPDVPTEEAPPPEKPPEEKPAGDG